MIPKFRAWDKLDNEMYLAEQINFYRGEFESIGGGITFLREADKIELMQSTGIKDKNGQEIFEGDIVEFEDEVWYTDGGFYENKDEAYDSVQTNNRVVIIYDGFEWDLDNFWKGTNDCSSAWMSIFEDHMQSFKYFLQNEASVIGNIYENPELLEADRGRD